MYQSVIFLSKQQALALVPDPDAVMVSLIVPGDQVTIPPGYHAVQQLEMHDISEETINVPVGSIPDEDGVRLVLEYEGGIYHWPDAHHARAIAGFLAAHEGGCSIFRTVIVHCTQGKSRSSAVARYVADRYDVPILNEQPEYQNQVAMSDTSRANPRLLRLLRSAHEL